jgi:putative transposase
MTPLRRYHRKGDICFITCVTYKRQPVLTANCDLLVDSTVEVIKKIPIELIAWVVMPDHFHAIIDTRNGDLSRIMQQFKLIFAALYRKRQGIFNGRVWQNRFWDHIIRDESDLRNHIDYIHYNPVRHGLAATALEYDHSSFKTFLKRGMYDAEWGIREPSIDGDFGE